MGYYLKISSEILSIGLDSFTLFVYRNRYKKSCFVLESKLYFLDKFCYSAIKDQLNPLTAKYEYIIIVWASKNLCSALEEWCEHRKI